MTTHLALIMDGNRRWAKSRQLYPWLGHKQGAQVVEMVMQYCIDNKIPYLSLYTFSLENFKRPEQEVSYLFSLINEAKSRIEEFVKAGVKIKFVGDLSLLPDQTARACHIIEQETSSCSMLYCNFLICYGGQQEILAAVKKITQISISDISLEAFKKCLWFGNIPDPTIIIRTGGVKRLSNFLLFQCAYAEIRFLDCLWPDLTRNLLHETVQHCLQANKNFGI